LFFILVPDEFREVVPALLPFYHIYGLLSLAIASLHLGCKVITVPKFEPEHFISTVVKNKVSNSCLYAISNLIVFKLER
jgi:acyl-CoA synthetase (AMP-forming)/AMP-acid ligase II